MPIRGVGRVDRVRIRYTPETGIIIIYKEREG